jgi:large subunit ribosomal protein L28
MKYSLQTMKPNVLHKTLYSDVLKTAYRLWITTKARRCIMKAGSFDQYLLTTKPEVLSSRMALHLRSLILLKMKNKSFQVPYVPG